MMKCRRFSRKVASTIGPIALPAPTMPTAIIWLAPAYTISDIKIVSGAEKPVCRADSA